MQTKPLSCEVAIWNMLHLGHSFAGWSLTRTGDYENISVYHDSAFNDMNDLILLGKALSDATRLRIIAALRQSELCVCELSDALEMPQSSLSTHLQVIRQAGLVATRKDGKWVYYAIEPAQVAIVEAVFSHHRIAMEADRRLRRDSDRLQRRLKIRENGCCTLGFNQLDLSKTKGVKP